MKINVECEKSDRLTFAKLNNVNEPYKQDYESKLMTEKYSLLHIKSATVNTSTDSFTKTIRDTTC